MGLFCIAISAMSLLSSRSVGDESRNFDNASGPEKAHFGAGDIGWQALAPALGCSLLATLVVAARWYSRAKLARCLGVDDYVILLSLVSITAEHAHAILLLTRN